MLRPQIPNALVWVNDKDGNQICIQTANINTVILFADHAGVQFANGTGVMCSLNEGKRILEDVFGVTDIPERKEPQVIHESLVQELDSFGQPMGEAKVKGEND